MEIRDFNNNILAHGRGRGRCNGQPLQPSCPPVTKVPSRPIVGRGRGGFNGRGRGGKRGNPLPPPEPVAKCGDVVLCRFTSGKVPEFLVFKKRQQAEWRLPTKPLESFPGPVVTCSKKSCSGDCWIEAKSYKMGFPSDFPGPWRYGFCQYKWVGLQEMTSVQGFDHVLPIVQQKVAAGIDAPKAVKG